MLKKNMGPQTVSFFSKDTSLATDRNIVAVCEGTFYTISRLAPNLIDIPIQAGRKLPRKKLIELAHLFKDLESEHKKHLAAEFSLIGESVEILRVFPLANLMPANHIYLSGTPTSPGVRTAPVKIYPARLYYGEILVVRETSNKLLPIMRKSGAILTETGGHFSHAAQFSRKFGIPCIVNIGKKVYDVKNSAAVTVDGRSGTVKI